LVAVMTIVAAPALPAANIAATIAIKVRFIM
jgi:hypothetical protein